MHGLPSTPQRSALGSLNGFSIPELPPNTPRRKSCSPGKSSSKDLSKARRLSPDKSMTSLSSQGITKKEQLAQMSPDITFYDIACIKDDSTPEPERLKAKLDTPMKTKDLPTDSSYALNLYDPKEMQALWHIVSNTAEQADEFRGNTQEPNWVSEVVGQLLSYVRTLSACNQIGKRTIQSLNISNASIAPIELCPTSPDHVFTDANKKIDHAYALRLTRAEERTLRIAGPKYRMTGPASINQTYGWTAFEPMFANVEVKNDNRDPLIQLGVWIAAEYEKRCQEGYPMDIPVPAIVVDRDYWMIWLAYSVKVPVEERNSHGKTYRVQFAGPKDIGNTKSIEGIFRILHVLKAIVRWGTNVYEPSYFEKVLAKCR
ncbi:MAG: hypothetical protein Q9166_004024 [cf. Caloplaca sp. 2 TL-2023]